MTTPHGHQWWCSVVSLDNQGTTVLIPNVGRAYFTVFSSLFFSLLLILRQLILTVMTGLVLWLMIQASTLLQLTSSWSAKPTFVAHLNKLVRHLTLGLVGEYHWDGTHLWVLDHAASHRKVSLKLSCVRKCTCSATSSQDMGHTFWSLTTHNLHHTLPLELVWVFWLANIKVSC